MLRFELTRKVGPTDTKISLVIKTFEKKLETKTLVTKIKTLVTMQVSIPRSKDQDQKTKILFTNILFTKSRDQLRPRLW